MAQVGRISGPLLEENLVRNGIDLAFRNDLDTTQLLYLDVNNGLIGVNTSTPSRTLEINGTTQTTNLISNTAKTPGFDITNSTFSAIGNIELDAAEAVVFANFENETIRISDNNISTINSNADIDITPTSNITKIVNNLNVYGDIYTPGNISFGGSITFGDQNTDTVTFNADITNNLIPNIRNTYNLGSNQKRWKELYTNLVNGQSVSTDDLVVGLIDFNFRSENIFYVSSAGSDTNTGTHIQDPFASISKALEAASALTNTPVVIRIFPGEYQEQLPLVVPVNVSIIGDSIRSVTIIPDTSSQSSDVFLLNGETTVANLTIKDFYYDSLNNTGYAFRFAPNALTTTRSPYIQNISVITHETSIGSADAGRGAWIDGSEMNAASVDASMLFHSCTFITPNADAIIMTNGVRVEWLNSFTYFANRGLYAVDGVEGRTSQDGSSVIYGAELRSIGSANVYGNYGAVADGPDTLMYLIKHNFGYIGSGLDSSNDQTLAVQENEVLELNGGKIYYQSTDHLGTFRVGDNFFVNAERRATSIDISALAAESLTGLVISTDESQTFITSEKVETGNIRFTQNRLDSLLGDVNIAAASNNINLKDNTKISKNLFIRDNFSFGGTLNIKGDEFTDKLTFNVKFDQDFNPNQTLQFDLGSKEKQWLTAYLSKAEVGSLVSFDNIISTQVSNANLEIRANGTGKIIIPNNNFRIVNNFTTVDTSTLSNTSINGDVNSQENITISNNFDVSNNLTVEQNLNVGASATLEKINISNNVIKTTVSNEDLELRAAGTGKIKFLNDVRILENLDADNIFAKNNVFVNLDTVFDSAIVSTITISNNFLETNKSNANLELRANASGIVLFENLTDIKNNLTTQGTSTLKNSLLEQGFGPELVNNGTFDNNISFWTSTGGGSLAFVDNALEVRALGVGHNASQVIQVAAGKKYNFTATIKSVLEGAGASAYQIRVFETGTGDLLSWLYPDLVQLLPTPIVLEGTFIPATNQVTIAIRSENSIVLWDDISIIEDLGLIETITPIDLTIEGNINQIGDSIQTGNISSTGNTAIDGLVNISSKTDFINYTIDKNIIENRRFGLSVKRTDPFNSLGFYSIILAMVSGATADNYSNQTEKNLINFLANGTEPPYANSYADANQNGSLTSGDALTWLQFVANGTSGSAQIDAFIQSVIDELIGIEFNNPGTFNKEVLLFGDYFIPDISLIASGSGIVKFTKGNVVVDNNLSAKDVTSKNINVVEETVSNVFTNAIVDIADNYIETTVSNADLELRSTKNIRIRSNEIKIDQNLSIDKNFTLSNTDLNNSLDHTGFRNQTGNLNIQGELKVTSFNLSSEIQFDDIFINDNFIETSKSNSNLELLASGSGRLYIPFNSLRISNNLTANDLITSNIEVLDNVESNTFITSDNIKIFDNVITTTNSNSNLELRKQQNRSVILEDINVNNSTVSSSSSIILESSLININASGAVSLPFGSTLQRPAVNNSIRFNTTDNVFEGLSNNSLVTFNGVYSSNRRTNIIASSASTLDLTINNVLLSSVNSTGLTVHGLQVDNINIDDNIVRTTAPNTNLVIDPSGTGAVVIDNIAVSENSIITDGVLTIQNTNNGTVKFDSTGAIAIPYGTDLERIETPETGLTRWNTEQEYLEVWDGTVYASAAGSSATISKEEFQDLMLEYTLIFG